MKLYYSEGACSLSPHIVLNELGIDFEAIKVDWSDEMTATVTKHNPVGAVPILILDNGQPLTEGVAIVQYLADQKPEANLAPKNGTIERTRLQETLNFISTELHKGYSPMFGADYVFPNDKGAAEGLRTYAWGEIGKRLDIVTAKLGNNDYLFGKQFTVADAYLFTVLSWTQYVGRSLDKWPTIETYLKRVAQRPAVQKTLKAEDLI